MGRSKRKEITGWGTAVAVLTFLALVFAFYVMVEGLRIVIHQAAVRELEARAEVAARYLEAPLKTLDFARIRRFGEECRKRGYELEISARSGGCLFDTRENPSGSASEWIGASAPCGENRIGLCRPIAEVLVPYERAKRLFVVSALIGAFGMFVVFFALYRQHVRIRELAKVEKFRREFIADLSHEIKTPLTGILGAVEMLDEVEKVGGGGAGGGVRARLVGMIGKESKRLNALVQEILDLARLEREGEKLNDVETDLAALVSDLAAKYHTVRALADRPVKVRCDPVLIEQAIANLVENAKRHSGSDDITLSLVPPSAPGASVRIVVEDKGIGIPPEHLNRIFERFHRVDPARAAESGGAGLGLSIVRRIARLHGGDVACENVVPHGARFTISIPA